MITYAKCNPLIGQGRGNLSEVLIYARPLKARHPAIPEVDSLDDVEVGETHRSGRQHRHQRSLASG
jgi:hypothetical protein